MAHGRLRHSLHPIRVFGTANSTPANANTTPGVQILRGRRRGTGFHSFRLGVPYRTIILSGRFIISDVVKGFEGVEKYESPASNAVEAGTSLTRRDVLVGLGFAVPSRKTYRGCGAGWHSIRGGRVAPERDSFAVVYFLVLVFSFSRFIWKALHSLLTHLSLALQADTRQ